MTFRYLDPNDPEDRQIILADLIDNEMENIELIDLFVLLREYNENRINEENFNYLLHFSPEKQETIAYITNFWQQIYFDYCYPED